MAERRPTDVVLLSYPRTLSNLLVKLLSEQPGWQGSTYFLHDAFQYADANLKEQNVESPADVLAEYLRLLHTGYEELLASPRKAHEQGLALFLKSHILEIIDPTLFFGGLRPGACPPEFAAELASSFPPRTNPTLLPDELLLSFVPVFLIRHPALVVDSHYRAKGFTSAAELRQGNAPYSTNVRLTKAIIDWYDNATATRPAATESPLCRKGRPLIVDADDVLEGDTMQRLAAAIGMNPARILEQWEAESTEGLDLGHKRFVVDLWRSTSIDRSKSAKGLDLEAKFESWNELYGVEVGQVMADLTNSHMEDYMWLKSRKF